jgi:hypothetical protein
MWRAWRNDQDRNGNAKRRRLEFAAVEYQLSSPKRRARFMERLKRRLEPRGSCLCYRGTLDHKGYPRLNLSYPVLGPRRIVTIHAPKMFLLIKLARPLKRGMECGHTPECEHRACVLHVQEEHYKSNAKTYHRRSNDDPR